MHFKIMLIQSVSSNLDCLYVFIYIFFNYFIYQKGCAMMIDSCESRLCILKCSWIKIKRCHTAVMIIWCQMQ